MAPKTIGRYRIKAELGRGGMSTVFLARDPHFDRDVAIKLLPVELSHHSTFRRRFEREAKVVAALADPAIVPVYDFGEEKGQPYLVMRFMTGGSLSDRLHQGPLGLEEASSIMSRLAPALDEVHSHNVVHRDLKPSNILFDQRNDPHISDFGTVKMSEATTQLTDTGGAVGTPAYMSPEQIQGEVELDGRSDIYTLGIILYEMLSGKHPYQSNTPIAVAVKHMFEPTPRILDTRPDLPPEVQSIINKAMAKVRDDRYPTAVAFANAIHSLLPDDQTDSEPVLVESEEPVQGRRLALIISNSDYKDPAMSKLIKPPANVNRLVDVLADPTIGGFDEVSTLVNEPADKIRRGIAHFFDGRAREDLLLLYFMGHAAIGSEEKLYFAAPDTEPNLLLGTAIPASFIGEVMDDSDSWQQVLIFDCIFCNASEKDSQALKGRVLTADDAFNRNGHERVILAASDQPQYVWEQDSVSGSALPSLFTHFFIEGLKNGAADHDDNGRVTIEELFAYINQQVERKTSRRNGPKPSKWASYAYQDSTNIIIANNPNTGFNHLPVPPKTPTLTPVLPIKQSNRPIPQKAFLAVGLLFISLIIFGGVWMIMNRETTPAAKAAALAEPTATETTTPTHTPTRSPTNTAVPSNTATPRPSNTPTQIPTAVITATEPVSETETAASTDIATAQLASSIFTDPDTSAAEITYIGIGTEVEVLGRSELGEWLYIQFVDDDFNLFQGFVHLPRMNWQGDFESLPVISDTAVNSSTDSTNCQQDDCTPLTLDAYPIPGSRCEGDIYYRTLFMLGQGGNGRYTYYWNDEKVAGPLNNDGYGFELMSADKSPVIGTAKVVSGDGQTVETELFISDFGCE